MRALTLGRRRIDSNDGASELFDQARASRPAPDHDLPYAASERVARAVSIAAVERHVVDEPNEPSRAPRRRRMCAWQRLGRRGPDPGAGARRGRRRAGRGSRVRRGEAVTPRAKATAAAVVLGDSRARCGVAGARGSASRIRRAPGRAGGPDVEAAICAKHSLSWMVPSHPHTGANSSTRPGRGWQSRSHPPRRTCSASVVAPLVGAAREPGEALQTPPGSRSQPTGARAGLHIGII